LEREQDPVKAWKLSVGDWKEREFWDDYTEAYEDAVEKCATDVAPWHVIPANRKWYRNYLITKTILETLEPLEDQWKAKLESLSVQMRAEVAEYRKTN
jgi:polyphosphate kinase 2 (PPK2 family)